MYRTTLLLCFLLALFPAITLGHNTTVSLEDAHQSRILALQNQIFAIEQESHSLKASVDTMSKRIAELRRISTTHDQDILKALDAINVISTTSLETNEHLGREIEALKKVQAAYDQHRADLLTALAHDKQELLQVIQNLDHQQKEILAHNNNALAATIKGLTTQRTQQDQQIVAMRTKITMLEKALREEGQAIHAIKTSISSNKVASRSQFSSLEAMNSRLLEIRAQSRTELHDIQESLTQAITYGWVSMVVVILFFLGLFFRMRRMVTLSKQYQNKVSSPASPVRQQDEDILEWLKDKEQPK